MPLKTLFSFARMVRDLATLAVLGLILIWILQRIGWIDRVDLGGLDIAQILEYLL